jgi:hypothetical protein
LAYPVLHFPPLFWVFFLVGGIPSMIIGMCQDAKHSAAVYHEDRADRRQRSANAATMAAALAASTIQEHNDNRVVNIDARQVHYHQENKARNGFIE